ncbi:MAG: hypothetical protein EB020_13160 [Proteobacteria bacterium]|nr:hypothetical protein [Pseudomonadota bacterium]
MSARTTRTHRSHVFVDTSAFYALADPSDANNRASKLIAHRIAVLGLSAVTTTLCLAELHALVLSPCESTVATSTCSSLLRQAVQSLVLASMGWCDALGAPAPSPEWGHPDSKCGSAGETGKDARSRNLVGRGTQLDSVFGREWALRYDERPATLAGSFRCIFWRQLMSIEAKTTTVTVPDDLLEAVTDFAERSGCGVEAVVHSALREFLRRETSDEASPDVVEAMNASLAEYEPVYRTLAQ